MKSTSIKVLLSCDEHTNVLLFAIEAMNSVKMSFVLCCLNVKNESKYKSRRKYEAGFYENNWTKYPGEPFYRFPNQYKSCERWIKHSTLEFGEKSN